MPVRRQTVSRKSCMWPLGLGVERAEGLVEQQHVGLGGQRPGDGHPLAHAARELAGSASAKSARPMMPSSSCTRAGALGLGPPGHLEPERDVLATVFHGYSE